MEMIDVLKKLEAIAETKPELVADALDNVSRTNPAEVKDSAVQTERVGGMSDIHIGAEEVVGEYTDADGNLERPKADVLRAMAADKAKASFPKSYEIEVAMDMVNDKFDDQGEPKPDMDMSSEEPTQDPEAAEGNAFAKAVRDAKAAGMKKGDKFKVGDEEHTLRDSDFEEESTTIMTKENKEKVNEDMHITTDSPEEANMLMQILKMAGVRPVDPSMMGMEPKHGSDMDMPSDDDAMGSMQMAKMRNMMMKPEMEKQEETFANSMGTEKEEPKYQDTDTLVNTMSGGLGRQNKTYPKVAPGDNPMSYKEDTVTAEDLANSFREQYEAFKESYKKVAETKAKPDYIDLDKDGNKTEPMKKAAKDKEAKEKK
jgi:hypothetical protein